MTPFWQHCLDEFEKELPAQQFITWIKPLLVEQDGDNTLSVIAPNRFVLQWVKDKFISRIQELGKNYFTQAIVIQLILE